MDAFVPLITDVEVPSLVLQGLAAVGGLFLAFKIFSFVYLLLELFVLPGASFSKFGPKGSWAVVTGASDGLGAEYARQLARKGFNLVLVSRTASKLEALSKELKAAHASLQTKLLPMDFTRNHDADYATLATLTAGVDVAVLINNVGVSHSIPVPFLDTPRPELDAIVAVNVVGTLRVTQLVAPQMIARRRGLILTMASFGGVTPTPLLATYSGSKAFLQQWSTALGAELAPAGVTVHLVQSYLVTSAMSKIRRTSAMIPNPKQFVRSALASVGLQRGSQGIAYSCTPYWTHAVMHWALTTFTGTMNSLVVNTNKSMHEDIRKRALRKAEREAKKA